MITADVLKSDDFLRVRAKAEALECRIYPQGEGFVLVYNNNVARDVRDLKTLEAAFDRINAVLNRMGRT